ncbi:acetyl-coenzyme A carboxylase carboxyl transferase subunit beta [Clostridia bacterium]|nr:acetyl-coenzyme A carboxylase carboxyl transferase subunit beta [Clostridia bacterium]
MSGRMRKFRRPRNVLEGQPATQAEEIVETLSVSCPKCKKSVDSDDLAESFGVCPYCRHHFKLNPRQRVRQILDEGSFLEIDKDLSPKNILTFPGYDAKIESAISGSGEKEGVVCGTGKISGFPVAIFVMNPQFMMGSMGSMVGEKITRLFELATKEGLPVLGFTVSGGARMQEGIVSLMQMAKTSGAVKRHSDEGLLYVCVLTDPTTGGVTASFAMEADIILAEPYALVAFAGPRVIEQTIRKKLPAGFQRAEFLLEKGFVDDIVDRRRQKKHIASILSLHKREAV